MRRLIAASMAVLLVLFRPIPAWPCLEELAIPTDPCADATAFGAEFLANLPRSDRLAPQDQQSEGEEVVVQEDTIELTEAEAPDCPEMRRRLEDPDAQQRLIAVEEVIDGTLDLEACPAAIAALGRIVDRQEDAFLVYRAIEPMAEVLEDPAELLGLLDHPSADVRRKVAEALGGEIFELSQSERIVAALKRESDPWTRIALADLEPEGKEAEVADILAGIVQDGGPTAPAALWSIGSTDRALEAAQGALHGDAFLRSAVIPWLVGHIHDSRARQLLLGVLQEGSTEERVHAAASLTGDPAMGEAAAWESVVLDPAVPLKWRVALVLFASTIAPWRATACDAKHADAELAASIDAVLADQVLERRFQAMELPEWPAFELVHVLHGVVRPEGEASVRCAMRPSGPPWPGAARIPAGTEVEGREQFTAQKTVWVGIPSDPICWVPADVLEPTADRSPLPDVLEADVSLDALASLGAALAAGDLELFDPVQGYTGIRLRDAGAQFQQRWRSGQDGVLQVLAAVEAKARLRKNLEAQNR